MIFLVFVTELLSRQRRCSEIYLSRVFHLSNSCHSDCMCHQNNYDYCCRCIVHEVKKVCEQVSKNIFNKNDNNVGLLRTVKKVWIQEEHSKQ